MRRTALLLLLAAILLDACSAARTADPARVIPRTGVDKGGTASRGPGGESRFEPDVGQPRIIIDRMERILALVGANLDGDPAEEQVIAVKRRDDVDAPVRIIVADNDPAGGQYYYQSWDSPTSATSTRVFNLYLRDLVGDHEQELVVAGMNKDGQLTLDVFKKVPSPKGQGLSFKSVCQIEADDVKVEEVDRSESYSTGQKNGESFPIYAYFRDPDSRNIMDVIRVPYTWKPTDNRYEAGPPEKIPGEKVAQKQLEKLYTGSDTASFESFLDGPWIKLRSPPDMTPKSNPMEIIHFQPRQHKICIYAGDTQEIYVWRESLRTLYDRLYVIGENDVVRKISRAFSVRATSLNTLEMSIQGTDLGETTAFTYARLGADAQKKYLGHDNAVVSVQKVALDGVYSNAEGVSLSFSGARLTWTEGGRSRSGSCVLMTISDHDILSVRFYDSDGMPGETRSYDISITEKRTSNKISRTLVLSPVNLVVSGFEDAVGDPVILERAIEASKK